MGTNYVAQNSTTVSALNEQLQQIQEALEDTLSRSGASPNESLSDYDMNGNRILNLPAPTSPTEPVRLQDLPSPAVLSNATILDNIQEMKTTNFSVGNYVVCKRYYAGGDLVDGLVYEIQASVAVDGFIDHELANGNVAKLLYTEALNAKQAGAVGDGVANDSVAIQSIINSVDTLYFSDGVYLVQDITLTSSVTLLLSPFASIKSITNDAPDLSTPSQIWKLTQTIFQSTTAGIKFKIIGGTIDCAGDRGDGLPAGSGPTSNTPNFGERAFTFTDSSSLIFRDVTFTNYLSDGLADAPLGDRMFYARDCDIITFNDCEFTEIGNEVTDIKDDRVTKLCAISIVNSEAYNCRGSFNVFTVGSANIDACRFDTFSGSPLNIFTDNASITGNTINNVTNSHGIDCSEGLYRLSRIVCSNNVITNVNDNGILCNGIDSVIANNTITNAGAFGINVDNSIGGNLNCNLVITGNVCVDCASGGVVVKGSGAGVPSANNTVSITNNILENKDVSLTSAIGILLNNQAGVLVANNMLDGYLTNHFKAIARADSLLISKNVFRQSLGIVNQTSHIMFFDGGSDSVALNFINISDNQFLTPPPKDNYTVFFTNYTKSYGIFPEFVDVSLKNNEGWLLYNATNGGLRNVAVKGSEQAGSNLLGTFNGGDTVLTTNTAVGQHSGYKILVESININGIYTFNTTPPVGTASITSGSNIITMSTSSHGITVGSSIRVVDAGGAGVHYDTIIIAVDGATLTAHTDSANTGSGFSCQFLGTALNKRGIISTLS